MSAFKVGQRVKRLGGHPRAAYMWAPPGLEGVIDSLGNTDSLTGERMWRVLFDSGSMWSCLETTLAPPTDPLAEQFIERIKKIAREPAPLVKEKA